MTRHARKKARVVRAWALKFQGAYVDFRPESIEAPEFRFTDDDGASWQRAGRVVHVDIREVVPKRKRARKGK